jgi:biotin transport system substrate-specific component
LALVGPSGGYLIGYLIGTYITGYLIENFKQRTAKNMFVAFLCGSLIVYFFGISWLALFVGLKSAFLLGIAPFIAGDFFKIVLSLKGLKALKIF